MSANNKSGEDGQLRSGKSYQRVNEENKNSLYTKSSLHEFQQNKQNNESIECAEDEEEVVQHHSINVNQEKKSSKTLMSCHGIGIGIVTLISALVSVGAILYMVNKSEESFNSLQTFHNEFNGIVSKYGEVLPDFGIRVMKKAVKNVINHNNSEPAVILLISSKEQNTVMECIVKDLVNAINKAYNESNSIKINGKQTNTNDINEKFEQTFEIERKHTIIIQNIESISTDHIMSLHQFTDHSNAKFINSIIIMTAINDKTIHLSKSCKMREMDEIAKNLLLFKWKDSMEEDQVYSLISRLTPSVVTILNVVTDETTC